MKNQIGRSRVATGLLALSLAVPVGAIAAAPAAFADAGTPTADCWNHEFNIDAYANGAKRLPIGRVGR